MNNMKSNWRWPLIAIIITISALQVFSQTTLTGKVIAEDTGQPLIGVNVLEKNTLNGTVTDVDGYFKISVPQDATLVFSFIGYSSEEIKVGNRTSIELQMQPKIERLEETVVIGYSSVKRKDLTGSIAVVDAEEAKSFAGTTITEGMMGKVAGVTILSTGEPGATPRVLIRGMGHFGDNTPLYVIDGIHTTEQPDFNPEDIESVQILKDASAAALYGTRGANGVIVITTKKGKSVKPKLTFYAISGIEQASKKIPMMNARDFADLNNMAYDNAGLPRMPGADSQFNPDIDTDWQDAFMKNGSIQNYNLTYSGGNSTGNYLFSAGYLNQVGIVLGPRFERYNFRVNTGINRGRLKVTQTLLYANTNSENLYYAGNPFIDMLRMLPTIPVYDPTVPGGFGIGSETNKTFGTNPVAAQELNDYNTYTDKIMGNVTAELGIFNFLTYKINLGLENNVWHNRRYRKPGLESFNRPQPYDELHEDRGKVYYVLIENTLNFNKSFGDHNLELMAGVSQLITDWKQLGGSVLDFPEPFPVMSAGTQSSQAYGTDAREGFLGYLGRLTYNYSGKYLLTVNFRRDGSSKFGPNYKWGNFPGVSAGWIISEEDFFNLDQINNLKLRGSYGILGNSDVRGSYNYSSYINTNVPYVFGTAQELSSGAITQLLSNADLRWQSKKIAGVGIDGAFFNNRFLLTLDYFNAITDDVLVNAPIPWTSGHLASAGGFLIVGSDPYSNVGKIKNQGFEFSGTYQETDKTFKYDITANISIIRNEVLRLSDGYEAIFYGPSKTTLGQPIGQFFLLRTDGIFQSEEEIASYVNANGTPVQPNASPGDIKYLDINGRDPQTGELTGEPDGIINLDDREFAGSPWPDFEYGITGNLYYKNFELSMFMDGSVGNKIFSNCRFTMERMDDNSNYPVWLDPWTEENKSNEYPRALYGAAAANNVYYESDRWLDNGSYLRLRSLRFGYNVKLPFIENANVYIQMQNLFTLSSYKMWDVVHPGWNAFSRGIDDGTFPNIRSYLIGVRFSL